MPDETVCSYELRHRRHNRNSLTKLIVLQTLTLLSVRYINTCISLYRIIVSISLTMLLCVLTKFKKRIWWWWRWWWRWRWWWWWWWPVVPPALRRSRNTDRGWGELFRERRTRMLHWLPHRCYTLNPHTWTDGNNAIDSKPFLGLYDNMM